MGKLLQPEGFGAAASENVAADHARRLFEVAGKLIALAEEMDGGKGDSDAATNEPIEAATPNPLELAAIARDAYRARRMRSEFFEGADLFGEPAWDFLLDLFIAACEGKSMPVTSACIGAAVPTTTALRWLSVLESRGLVEREADDSDARRVFVRLSPKAENAMKAYFSRLNAMNCGDELRPPHIHG